MSSSHSERIELVKSAVAGGEIDQVSAVGKNGAKRIAQRMLAKSPDLGRAERLRKPLHVVLHEDLHRCAAGGASAVDGGRNPARRRDVRAQERGHPVLRLRVAGIVRHNLYTVRARVGSL